MNIYEVPVVLAQRDEPRFLVKSGETVGAIALMRHHRAEIESAGLTYGLALMRRVVRVVNAETAAEAQGAVKRWARLQGDEPGGRYWLGIGQAAEAEGEPDGTELDADAELPEQTRERLRPVLAAAREQAARSRREARRQR